MSDTWDNNLIQFARLISELEAVGAFTPAVTAKLSKEMDLDKDHLKDLTERAQQCFEAAKVGNTVPLIDKKYAQDLREKGDLLTPPVAVHDEEYADVVWVPEDVTALRPGMSIDQAAEFLAENEDHIRDRLVEHAQEHVIPVLLGYTPAAQSEASDG